MSKKTLIIILFIIFPLAVGQACLISKPEPTVAPIEEPVQATEEVIFVPTDEPTAATIEEQQAPSPQPIADTTDLVMLDNSFWIQDGSSVFVGYLFSNPSRDILYEDVEFTIKLLGASGNLIDSNWVSMPQFFPNQTRGLISTFWISDESVTVNSVDVDWTFTGTSTAGDSANPLTSDQVIFWENDGYPIVTGKLINNTSTTYTDLRADIICFGNTGEIVGGGIAYVDFIHLNDYMGFTAYVDTFGDVASVEVFPSLTYGTQNIDKTDFLSEISIQESYFYEDDFGYFQGGLVVKNQTDKVLRNSHIYITFYDAEDNITTTGNAYIDVLLPGDSLGISPWISTQPKGAISTRQDILILPGETEDNYELVTNPFTVNSTTVSGDYDNYVVVNFTNTFSKQVSQVDVFVLVYNAAGQIIGGGKGWTEEPTPAGSTSELEVWVSYSSSKTIDSIKAWVIPSYWTEFD